ncbi:MAG: thioredoxin domain-containing protein [Anaerolineae bacterium]|nr:thioredoxin domain-containing protein [Anaerolineae bacterium]
MANRSRRKRTSQKVEAQPRAVPGWALAGLLACVAFLAGFVAATLIFSDQQPAEGLYTAEEVEAMIAHRLLNKPPVEGYAHTFRTVDGDPAIGPKDAPVEIVEYSDFSCGYCGRFYYQTLQPILDAYGDKVRFVYRDAPVLGAYDAAYAAECANEQGRFWEYHNYLFANQGSFGPDLFTMIAKRLDLDIDAFEACLASDRVKLEVEGDFELANDLDLTGTPGFTINGKFFVGAQPFDYFKDEIEAALAEAGG